MDPCGLRCANMTTSWHARKGFNARRAGGSEFPLYGLAFAAKDNIDVAGLPTTAGCPAFAYTPRESAPVVERLERAGAICIGKTHMDQFATGLVGTRSPRGPVPNPFNAGYVCGGSSSGSAVAVALGHVGFALGTDTAGSGRIPAAFNNLIGVKPTRGLLSTRGVVPACRSLDCVAILARDLATAWRALQVAAWHDEDDVMRAQGAATTRIRSGRPAWSARTPGILWRRFGPGAVCCRGRAVAGPGRGNNRGTSRAIQGGL